MGEWSEYLEDFPEENDANYVGGYSILKRQKELGRFKKNKTWRQKQPILN